MYRFENDAQVDDWVSSPRDDAAGVLKTLIATLINTPLMVYLVLPWITARLKRWL